jgi:hypothetical protein
MQAQFRLEGRAIAFVGSEVPEIHCGCDVHWGHPVLSDDIAALEERGGRFHVSPAYPRLSLRPSCPHKSHRKHLPGHCVGRADSREGAHTPIAVDACESSTLAWNIVDASLLCRDAPDTFIRRFCVRGHNHWRAPPCEEGHRIVLATQWTSVPIPSPVAKAKDLDSRQAGVSRAFRNI